MTGDTRHMTHDKWHLTYDMKHLTPDTFQVTPNKWPMTCDTWNQNKNLNEKEKKDGANYLQALRDSVSVVFRIFLFAYGIGLYIFVPC